MNKLIKKIEEYCKWELNMADLHSSEEAKWRSHVAKRILSAIHPEGEGYSMEETMEFVRDHFLQWELIGHHTDHDAYLEFHNYRTSEHFCKYPYRDEHSLIEGIHFIMDMHYLRGSREETDAGI